MIHVRKGRKRKWKRLREGWKEGRRQERKKKKKIIWRNDGVKGRRKEGRKGEEPPEMDRKERTINTDRKGLYIKHYFI